MQTKALKAALALAKQGKIKVDEDYLDPSSIKPGTYPAEVVSVKDKENKLIVTLRVFEQDDGTTPIGLISRRCDLASEQGAIMAIKTLMSLGGEYREDADYSALAGVSVKTRLAYSDDGQYVNVRGITPFEGRNSAAVEEGETPAEEPEQVEEETPAEEPEGYSVGDKVTVDYDGTPRQSEVVEVVEDGYQCAVDGTLYEFEKSAVSDPIEEEVKKTVVRKAGKKAPVAAAVSKAVKGPSKKVETPAVKPGARVQFDSDGSRIVGSVQKISGEMATVKDTSGEVWTVPLEMLSAK